jgi:indolepyruvate ferredoxin oxidoreductase beta subunit
MTESVRQQIIISGVGGQGVLFVTRLLAESAIRKGLAVFTSETHGMAQRGGTVLSHLKVGDFASPLIRPSRADGLLVLKAENLRQHGAFLKPDGWAIVNGRPEALSETNLSAVAIDADSLAQKIGNVKSVNLIVLGFALAETEQAAENRNSLFCGYMDIEAVLEKRFSNNKKMLSASMKALQAGYEAQNR